MIRIVTDTSTFYTPEEGKKIGIDVLPLSVTVDGKTYVEYVDIDSESFLKIVKDGGIPSSSQPAIGKVMDCYEQYPDDVIINLSMADGLSGTYQSAVSARSGMPNEEKIHVINTKTLAGPHRYLVDRVIELVKEGKSLEEIFEFINYRVENNKSFLMPRDFNFLKRGGRITPLAATIGGMLKIQPIVEQAQDGRVLEKYGVSRTMMGAAQTVLKEFLKEEDPLSYRLFIVHAGVEEDAIKIKEYAQKKVPGLNVDIYYLSPAFITQGGPGCIAIQWMKE